MSIDKKTIEKIANLAKLNLSKQEMLDFPKQLSKIVAFAEKINKLDLKNVPLSLSGAESNTAVWRPDRVKPHKNKNIQNNLDSRGFLVVPKVLDK